MADANAAKAPKPSPKPIKDVTNADETAPSPNSKSVIVNNRTLLKDPMVTDGGDAQEKSSGEALPKKSDTKLTAPLLEDEGQTDSPKTAKSAAIKPPAQAKADKKADDESDKAQTVTVKVAKKADPPAAAAEEPEKPVEEPKPAEEPAVEEPAETKDPEPAEEPAPQPDETTEEPAEEPAKADDAAAPTEPGGEESSQPSKDNAQQEAIEAEAKKEAERQASVQKLTDSKKYYLPINSVEKRKAKHFVILGLLLAVLLALAWVDVALDAGLIHINGIKAPTQFFSN